VSRDAVVQLPQAQSVEHRHRVAPGVKKIAVPPRPDEGLPPPPPPYSVFARGVAIGASVWWPYVALAVALVMLLFQRDQAKRAALKKWAKWTAVYFAVWIAGIVLFALMAGDPA
jgi:hypothetical protein